METSINRKRKFVSGLILFIGVVVGISVLAYTFGFSLWSSTANLGKPQFSTKEVITQNSLSNPFNFIERFKENKSKDMA